MLFSLLFDNTRRRKPRVWQADPLPTEFRRLKISPKSRKGGVNEAAGACDGGYNNNNNLDSCERNAKEARGRGKRKGESGGVCSS